MEFSWHGKLQVKTNSSSLNYLRATLPIFNVNHDELVYSFCNRGSMTLHSTRAGAGCMLSQHITSQKMLSQHFLWCSGCIIPQSCQTSSEHSIIASFLSIMCQVNAERIYVTPCREFLFHSYYIIVRG